MSRKQAGFSLIELLLVVAVILIIAAIAIPSLLHAKMLANEASAADALHALNTAAANYASTYTSYPPALANLGPGSPATATTADLIDSVLASGSKSGYTFTYVAGTADASGNRHQYTITANPTNPTVTGTRYFFTDESYVIRVDPSAPATASSGPLQ
jgi:type IV pilus assembly protein PilA